MSAVMKISLGSMPPIIWGGGRSVPLASGIIHRLSMYMSSSCSYRRKDLSALLVAPSTLSIYSSSLLPTRRPRIVQFCKRQLPLIVLASAALLSNNAACAVAEDAAIKARQRANSERSSSGITHVHPALTPGLLNGYIISSAVNSA